MRDLIESGALWDKSTVRDLIAMHSEPSMSESFTSEPIQEVFDFLCAKFDIVGDQYDQWVEVGLH